MANKNKGKKTDRHFHFCNRHGHLESKFFKKMEALEATMKKHNIHLEHSSISTSSLGISLSACGCQASQSGYALNVFSSSHSHEWLIDSRASYHMTENKAMFSSLNDCNTKNIYVGDDRSLSVVGTATVYLDNGQFNDVLCVPTLSCNLLSVYQITHSGEDVKGYRLIPLKSKNVIIRRDVNFAENISAYKPSSPDVPPLSIPSTSKKFSSSDDDSEDDNPPPPSQDPPPAPQLPKCVVATQDVVEASSHPDWDVAMNEEYRSLLENDTWDLVPLPKGWKLVRCKWVYRTKYGPDGKVDKHKACLAAKCFSKVEGIDYTETFSPVAKMNSIHLVLSLATSFKWEVH
eukprot:PITA_32467